MIKKQHFLGSWRAIFTPDVGAFLGLLGLLFIFYPDLFLVKAAPLTGDHLEQHYPWAFLLAKSVKEFRLPFWTPLIHCGFPLVSESQVGAFYIPNLLMYFFLPLHAAFSYMNLLHWLIAGWGTYLYTKQMKLGAMPSFVAAIIFTFGSAYGGAYYNMTSLKTICWFPLALYFLERYLSQKQWRFLTGMALLISQSIVAGYLQIAAFTWMIFGVYTIMRVFIFQEVPASWTKKALTLGALAIAAVAALILASPQIFLTFQMAMMSNRTGLEEGYAYLGSMSPLVLGTLFNPNLSLISTGSNLYAGYLTLFLVLVSFFSQDTRESPFFRLWVALAVFALLLALGRWSPLYVAFVKLTRFYSFRVPAKFLGFFCFGLAMLGALGFQVLWQGRSSQAIVKKAFRALISILAIYAASIAFTTMFLTLGRNIALKLGETYVMRFVYAQPGHPHSLETYFAIVKTYPDNILKFLSWNDPANICAAIMAIFCVILVWVFLQKKIISRALLGAGILFLVLDLYAASYLDIKMEFATYQKVLAPSPVIKILERERIAGRLGRIYGFRSPDQRLPLTPSQNMLYGIEDIGAYSPLVTSRYYQTIGLFGNVNDSTLAFTPTPAFVRFHLPLLSFLNVSHVLSATPLSHAELRLLYADPAGAIFLYRNERGRADAYFIRDVKLCSGWNELKRDMMANDFVPARQLLLDRSEYDSPSLKIFMRGVDSALNKARVSLRSRSSADEIWDILAPADGFFVIPRTFYSGWKVWTDGKEAPILNAYGLFQAVYIGHAGRHTVRFEFHPLENTRRS